MQALIVYTSRTGNTKQVAEALASAFGIPAVKAEDAPSPEKFDVLLLGSGVYNGLPDAPMLEYIKRCRRKKIGLFFTMGAYPAKARCVQRTAELLPDCTVAAGFCCQGRYAEERIELMKNRPADSPHAWTPEKAARVAEAQKHPNDGDFIQAVAAFREFLMQNRETKEKSEGKR